MKTSDKKKNIISVKKWNWTYTQYDDGSTNLQRDNDGFLAFELLGLIENIKLDILDQIRGITKPTVQERIIRKGGRR